VCACVRVRVCACVCGQVRIYVCEIILFVRENTAVDRGLIEHIQFEKQLLQEAHGFLQKRKRHIRDQQVLIEYAPCLD
jgi:hypothetical protein